MFRLWIHFIYSVLKRQLATILLNHRSIAVIYWGFSIAYKELFVAARASRAHCLQMIQTVQGVFERIYLEASAGFVKTSVVLRTIMDFQL